MIEHLRGRVIEAQLSFLVVEVGGLGLGVHVPATLTARTDQAIDLHVHFQLRDDGATLFGFATVEERRLFRMLNGVAGVGPRLSLALLGGLPYHQLVRAIGQGDELALRGVSGVGAKTAKRIITELRETLGGAVEPAVALSTPAADAESVAVEALVRLGYRRVEAAHALGSARGELGGEAGPEALVKAALRHAAATARR